MSMTSWARVQAILEAAEAEAERCGTDTVGAEHLVTALAVLGGPVGMVLARAGLSPQVLRNAGAIASVAPLERPARSWLERRTRDTTAAPALRILKLPQCAEVLQRVDADAKSVSRELRKLPPGRAWATVQASSALLPDTRASRALMIDHFLPYPADVVEKVARDPRYGESFTRTAAEDRRTRHRRTPRARIELVSGVGEGNRFAWLYRVTGGAGEHRDEPTAYLDIGITSEEYGCSVRMVRAQALHGVSGTMMSAVAGRALLRSGLIRAMSRLAIEVARQPGPLTGAPRTRNE